MKYLFSKKTEKSNGLAGPESGNLFQQYLKGWEAAKRRLADKLQSRTNGYTRRKKIILLAALVMVLSSYNIWLISRSLFSPRTTQGNLKSILRPVKIPPTQNIVEAEQPGISKESYEQLMSYKNLLDSLEKIGDPEYLKIRGTRPGLIDSLNLLQQLYQMQKTP